MKDAYYFPHDSNATQDPKMMVLLSECGLAGIGAFWIIIEILHQQECCGIAPAQLTHCIQFYGRQGAWDQLVLDKIEKVLFDQKLLVIEDGLVTSTRVKKNIQKRCEISNIAKERAAKRWGKNAKAMPTQCTGNAIKGKERKRKNTTLDARPANSEEVTSYAKSIGFELDGQKFIDYYEAKGWMIGKSPMRSWKASVRIWKANGYGQDKPSPHDRNWKDPIYEEIKRKEQMKNA